MNTIVAHKKKVTLLVSIILGYLGYKHRTKLFQMTFQKFLQRMNDKLMNQMDQRVKNVESYNNILAQIQEVDQQYYNQKNYKQITMRVLGYESLMQKKDELSNLDKSLPNYKTESTTLFTNLNCHLFVFNVSTVVCLRYNECLFYLVDMIYMKNQEEIQKLLGNYAITVLNILNEVQENIAKSLYMQIKIKIESILNRDQKQYNYTSKTNQSIDLIRVLVEKCQDVLMTVNWEDINRTAQLTNSSKFDYLSQMIQDNNEIDLDLQMKRSAAQKMSLELVQELIKLNQSAALQTFFRYAVVFSYQKLENRYLYLKYKSGTVNNAELLFRSMTQLNKICLEEFIGMQSEESNENYYKVVLKQALKQDQVDDSQLIPKVLHEHKIERMITQAQRQIARKIIFTKEIEEQSTTEHNTLHPLLSSLMKG